MEEWDSATWWGAAVVVWILLALPLLARQATDDLVKRKNPNLPNQDEEATTGWLSWLWIGGLVLLLLLSRAFGQ